jgi:GrpB-like predicted nucleotidyltransferase (UPF0157 family)
VSGPSDRVELVEHDPRWSTLFEEERDRLLEVFDAQALGIEHIGSTSVPGLCAKPIVDVLVGLDVLELSKDQVAAMEELGYEFLGEYGLAGRLYFRKHPRTHNVHVVQYDGDHWGRHLVFRDALRSDPQERQRYDELKRRLAAEGHPLSAYAELKTPFIRAIEDRYRARSGARIGVASERLSQTD